MFDLTDVTHGAGLLAVVPGGLFELSTARSPETGQGRGR